MSVTIHIRLSQMLKAAKNRTWILLRRLVMNLIF